MIAAAASNRVTGIQNADRQRVGRSSSVHGSAKQGQGGEDKGRVLHFDVVGLKFQGKKSRK